jgi:hypothetical protein
MNKHDLNGEIRLHVEGQNEYPCLPLWRTGDGSFYLPRKGEAVFQDGKPFEVFDLEWRYVGRELRYVVVHAGTPPKPIVKLCGQFINPDEPIVINDSEDRHYHQCILPETPLEYKSLTNRVEVHLCSCGVWWTVTR